jgi:ankyrin repeat protein
MPNKEEVLGMRGISTLAAVLLLCLAGGAQNSSDRLFQAVRNNDLAFLKTKLAKGADVNARGPRGATPLVYAAAYGSREAVKLLLDAGADVNAKNDFDATALIFGANDPEKARLLVAKGADVNARSKMGRTPLMIAASCDGCGEAVRLLLAKGADAKARDAEGATALQAAADSNHLDAMRQLIANGADVRAADGFGYTPLISAAAECNLDAIRLLLQKGAAVNAANTDANNVKFGKIALIGLTPLMVAAPYCRADVVGTLLEAEADVNARDIRKMTPLMLAVASEAQDQAVLRLLLKAGADVNAKSGTGETALDWAKKFGDQRTVAALIDAGAHEGAPFAAPERPAAKPRPVRQASAAATDLLQRSNAEFFRQSGCVSCHSQAMTGVAVAAARRAGVAVDEAAAADNVKIMDAFFRGPQERFLERMHVGGETDPEVFALLALAAEGVAGGEVTDTMALYIAGAQRRDGAWRLTGVARAPMEEGVIGRTAMAMHAIQLYGPPAKKAEFAQRVARARGWLAEAEPSTNDDLAMKMTGLHWAGAPAESVERLARTLIAAQREDGGWAQNRNLQSDAYATGETLWALREAGALRPSETAYRRGVQYLLETQWEDGSWYVRSRAPKFQPYFQSGFPFDHDQWISASATAWAVRALAPEMEKEAPATR